MKRTPQLATAQRVLLKLFVHRRYSIHLSAVSVAAVALLLSVLFFAGKSHNLQASLPTVIEIPNPQDPLEFDLPQLRGVAESMASGLPRETTSSLPVIAVANGSVFHSGRAGIYTAGSVLMTPELVRFAQSLFQYLGQRDLDVVITSALRSGQRQLELVKQRIEEYGMRTAFPELERATVRETSLWMPAWQWLRDHHVPVSPPSDAVDDDGNRVGASQHLKGLALDLSSPNLYQLERALADFSETPAAHQPGALQVSGMRRESGCVHLSLTR